MKLVIFGPQASGKGTQAEMLASELGITHINIGERLREEVASGSALGTRIKEHLDRGELVGDDLAETMIRRAIQDAHGKFVLDGFPRTKAQAEFLDLTTHIDKVIVLTISDKTAIARIGGRRECAKGHDYHVTLKPPKKEGVCDEDGLPLRKRADDTAAAIMKRLQIYHEKTQPILDHYKDKMTVIDGEPSIRDVHFAILKALHKHRP